MRHRVGCYLPVDLIMLTVSPSTEYRDTTTITTNNISHMNVLDEDIVVMLLLV